MVGVFFFSSRRRHTRWTGDWSSDVCSSDLRPPAGDTRKPPAADLQTHRGFWIQRDIDAGTRDRNRQLLKVEVLAVAMSVLAQRRIEIDIREPDGAG